MQTWIFNSHLFLTKQNLFRYHCFKQHIYCVFKSHCCCLTPKHKIDAVQSNVPLGCTTLKGVPTFHSSFSCTVITASNHTPRPRDHSWRHPPDIYTAAQKWTKILTKNLSQYKYKIGPQKYIELQVQLSILQTIEIQNTNTIRRIQSP